MVEYPLLFFVTGDDVRLNSRYDRADALSQASAARGVKATRESRVAVFRGRISLWDNLKFMAIVLVVVGHFADYLTETSMVSRSIRLFIYYIRTFPQGQRGHEALQLPGPLGIPSENDFCLSSPAQGKRAFL